MLVEGKHNELVAKEKKRWQRGPKGTVMEMNVHPVKHFGEPNEERTGDDCVQDKQALSVVVCFVAWLKVHDNIQDTGVISECNLKVKSSGEKNHDHSCQKFHE